MTGTTIIVVAVVTSAGAIGAGVYKFYNQPAAIEQNVNVETHRIDQVLHDIVAEQMQQRDSDMDTEIDIKINIHTTHSPQENNDVSNLE